jgi:hypothetical protein
MPLAVVSSSSTAWTIKRSPRGLRFIQKPPFGPDRIGLGTLASRVPIANGNRLSWSEIA